MPNTWVALRIAAVVFVMLTRIMQAPNQKSFQEGGGHTICMGTGNTSLFLEMEVHHDLVRYPKSCLPPADCTFLMSGKNSSAIFMM